MFKVVPEKYSRGYCPTLCKTRESALREQEKLNRITPINWIVIDPAGEIVITEE